MDETLIFNISSLLDKSTGTSEVYNFDGPVEFDDTEFESIEAASNITGKVEIMRIEEGFDVIVKNVKVKINLECEKCLDIFPQDIEIPMAERRFLLNSPKNEEDINDIYLVDKKHQKIDLQEMIRQEIILHFPIVRVCSTSCKGLCPVCGKNSNKEKCSCEMKDEEVAESKPLADLKKLLK